MTITGKQLINGDWVDGDGGLYVATNPTTGEILDPPISIASQAQVELAVNAAHMAYLEYRHVSLQKRSAFLRTCANEIMALGDALLTQVTAETGYSTARAQSERGRVCQQLNMFADYIIKGDYIEARIDTADSSCLPARPDIRYANCPIGVVAVFGASNFPLAFSVAGGDTVSALAAGCSVVAKGHPSHPGCSELVAQALVRSAIKHQLPPAIISLITDSKHAVGASLVSSPAIKAVAFTGSNAGGMALFNLANSRPEPIPVFAEMGSINPIVLLPNALLKSAQEIAEGFVSSLTLGTGQFCVNPGLIIALDDDGLDCFIASSAKLLQDYNAGVMLNENICNAYKQGVENIGQHKGVKIAGQGKPINGQHGFYAQAILFETNADYFLTQADLQGEVFGPASLIVKCQNLSQMLVVVNKLHGQLSGTIHAASDDELLANTALVDSLASRVGRLVINDFPTGVQVCHSMVHGGPFPASTDSRFTSVGTAAIKRFVRPLCYQNMPPCLLPEALQNDNPLNLQRTINGEKTTARVS